MDHLQAEISDALHASKPKRKTQRFRVRSEDGEFPVLKLWRDGFEVAEDAAPRMRGHVDILEGDERVARCLVVLAKAEFGVATYEFKHRTEEGAQRPVDYARDETAPVALLT